MAGIQTFKGTFENPELSILDARKFTYYATQEREVDRWAIQLQQLLEGDGGKLMKDPLFIQPINWSARSKEWDTLVPTNLCGALRFHG